MPFKKVSMAAPAWFATFILSALTVGIYASFCYSQRIYALDWQRTSDMTASFIYGGMLGGWLGVLGMLLVIWMWNGTVAFLEECAAGVRKMEAQSAEAKPWREAHS